MDINYYLEIVKNYGHEKILPTIESTIYAEFTLFSLSKIYKFLKNLNPNKKFNNPKEKELFLDAFNYVSISTNDLVEYYAKLLNNNDIDKNSDLYKRYFKILSNLTRSDLILLENIYNHRPYIINNDNIDLSLSLNIESLVNNFLLKKTYSTEEFLDNFSSSPKYPNQSLFRITEIGIDFYEKCNDLK